MADKPNTRSLRERKQAQPKAVSFFSEAEKNTIKATIGKNLSDSQFSIFVYTCQALGLNPLLNEVACVTYKNQDGTSTMSIQVMRDGFLTIAHRSGKFAGLESGVKGEGANMVGWAKIYHKDFTVPIYQEADFSEYSTNRNLWSTKPKTMIKKVAESMALRKAFNIAGVYSPEEMDKELPSTPKTLEVPNGDSPASKEQFATVKSLYTADEYVKYVADGLTKQEAAELIQSAANKK